MASSSGARPTPPPLRLTLKSYDKLTQISMKIRWIDEHGEEQMWNSWEDALCGRFGATKVLPSSSAGIQVRFRSQPGGRKVHGVDRKSRSAWTRRGEEVIELRPDAWDEVGGRGVDAWFEIRGPITHCHVWRAWNSCNEGRPDEWEWWPDFPDDRRAPPPATLQAADAAAPWPGSCEMSPASSSASPSDEATCTSAVTGAMSRLVAAAAVLLAVRRKTLQTLEELNKQITKQWYRVNSGNTAAAGLAVASFGSLFVAPPLAIAFGAGSAVTGVGSSTQDAVVEAEKGRNLARLMEIDLSEQLGFESVESELRCALSSAASHHRSSPRRHAGRALAVYTQTANLMLVRSAKYVTLTQAGTETMLIAGRVLGGLGAGLAVGVAVHGWSTTKPMQKLVQEKIAEVERSIEYLDGVHQRISGALRCPCCEEPLGLGATSTLRRCPQFHCFHAACVGEDGSCPVCAKSVSDLRAADQLPALLGLVGLRDLCTLTVDSLTPQIRKGAELVQRLGGRADEVRRLISGVQKDADDEKRPGEETPTSRQRREQALHEDAETHEAWQEFLASRDLAELETEELEGLLSGRRGMPLKYRHLLWPKLLPLSSGDYEALTEAELPQKVLDQINADVPRTRRDLVAPERRDALRRVLHATAAKRPHVGYAQGMNQLAAVLLKLGFDEETCCWLMDAIIEELLPGCHHPDLHGLFRDTAVADILIQTFLPNHAMFFESAGIEVLWFTVDYFITLGSADSSLPLIATLWDLCLLRGPRGLFSGFLAVLEMYFPLPGDPEEWKELSEPEVMMARYKEALAEASGEGLADCVADFLHHRQGGVSSELVASLRNSVGGAG